MNQISIIFSHTILGAILQLSHMLRLKGTLKEESKGDFGCLRSKYDGCILIGDVAIKP